MITAMALFAVEDALLKWVFQTVPIGLATALFGLGGFIIFLLWAVATGQRPFQRAMLSRIMVIRFGFEITGRLFYFLAIALTTLSAATVILQATPILVVAAAAILFKERVGPRRWVAIGIGFIGVLIVIRPGADAFTPLSILAVIGLIGFAGRDLTSRMAPASLGATGLGITGFFALTMSGLAYGLWAGETWAAPALPDGLLIVGVIGVGVTAYSALMRAMRTGDVSAVTPFRYTRLIFGVSLGVVMFGETLDAATMIGSALIVLSGLFILWRGRTAQSGAVTKV